MLEKYSVARKKFEKISKLSFYGVINEKTVMTGFKKNILLLVQKEHFRSVFSIMKPAIYAKFRNKKERVETL